MVGLVSLGLTFGICLYWIAPYFMRIPACTISTTVLNEIKSPDGVRLPVNGGKINLVIREYGMLIKYTYINGGAFTRVDRLLRFEHPLKYPSNDVKIISMLRLHDDNADTDKLMDDNADTDKLMSTLFSGGGKFHLTLNKTLGSDYELFIGGYKMGTCRAID